MGDACRFGRRFGRRFLQNHINGRRVGISIVRTMARLSRALTLLSLLCGTLFGTFFWGHAAARDTSLRFLNARRLEAAKRWEVSAHGRRGANDPRRAADTSPPSRVKNITFNNPKASSACSKVHALPRLFVSCVSRLLREWYDPPPSQL